MRAGNLEEAVKFESRAVELDPLAPVHLTDLAYVQFMLGNYPLTESLARRALEKDPAFTNGHQNLMAAHWVLGDLEQYELTVRNAIESLQANEYERLGFEISIDFAKGDVQQAREKIQFLTGAVGQGRYDAVNLAFAAARIGEFDTAGEMLLKAIEAGDGTWMFPLIVRLPEQAPESEPWQRFWSLPGPARVSEIRRANGMSPHFPAFGAAKP